MNKAFAALGVCWTGLRCPHFRRTKPKNSISDHIIMLLTTRSHDGAVIWPRTPKNKASTMLPGTHRNEVGRSTRGRQETAPATEIENRIRFIADIFGASL